MIFVPFLVFVLWVYFFLAAVEPDGPAEIAMAARLPHRFMFPGDMLRALICIVPLSALLHGRKLDNNPLFTWIVLATLIEPLLIPSGVAPKAEDSVSLGRFAARWVSTEIDRTIKTALLLAPMLLLNFFVSSDVQADWLSRHFSFVQREEKSLDLSIGFYLLAVAMLALRFTLLLGVPSHRKLFAFSGWTSGIIVILYFYNLTGQVQLSEHEWDYPLGGITISLVFKFVISFIFARIDRRLEKR